jgi:hypothetical protein
MALDHAIESPHERRDLENPLHALRRPDGNARSGARHAVDARSVLGLPAVRPAFLDHISPARPAEAETRRGTDPMTAAAPHEHPHPPAAWFDDEIDDDIDDEFDDDFDDEDEAAEDDDGDDDEEEPETWQVRGSDLRQKP